MAKRFIDTGLFDDSWFMDLSKDCKLLWIYIITKCNHAGIIEFNPKLWQFHTGIKSIQTVIKGLSNRLVTVNNYFFIPKFLYYQYPNFPNSSVRAQKSAIDILIKYKLFNEEKETVIKPLTKGYVYVYDNGSDNDNDKEDKYFRKFKHLKITIEENKKILDSGYTQKQINDIYDSIENHAKNTNYTSLYLTALNWLKKDFKPKKQHKQKDQSDFSTHDKGWDKSKQI